MARLGYAEEYLAKKLLAKEYRKNQLIKVAIGGAMDYVIVSEGKLILVVEVKACHSDKYYPSKRDKEQFKRIEEFCKDNNVRGEVWVKYPHKEFIKYQIGEI